MFRIKTKLWKWQTNKAAWHFLTIDKKLTAKINASKQIPKARGFGSIRVQVTIGNTRWPTSIFPTKEGEFLLPVKAGVRKKEGLKEESMVEVSFEPIFLN